MKKPTYPKKGTKIPKGEIAYRYWCSNCKEGGFGVHITQCPKCRSENLMWYMGTEKYVTGNAKAAFDLGLILIEPSIDSN